MKVQVSWLREVQEGVGLGERAPQFAFGPRLKRPL